jgi:probable F420-dependent oxidoreductase
MKLGLFGINMDLCATDPAVAVRVAQAAEAAGWESVWTGEHYVLPDPSLGRTPAPPETPLLDPFVALTNVAAHTTTLLVGTGVTVVPVHQPLVLAKKVASLDRMSGGRFLFGVGVGYLAPEFAALGVPLADRGARLDEHLDALRAIWNPTSEDGFARFDGRFTQFADVRSEPLPLQLPTPPLHFGGYVPASFARAVTQGAGWYGFNLDLAGTEACIAALGAATDTLDRPAELGPVEISVTPRPRALAEHGIAAFADVGVDRLILLPPAPPASGAPATGDPAAAADALVAWVEELGPQAAALG